MLTKASCKVIIWGHLRECWNGRQARLRCVWLRRVGSSPISRTIKAECSYGHSAFILFGWDSKNQIAICQWHVAATSSKTGWLQLFSARHGQKMQTSPISRTKISATPYGVADIFMLEMGLESPARAKRGYKTVRWTVLQGVGESLGFEMHPVGM